MFGARMHLAALSLLALLALLVGMGCSTEEPADDSAGTADALAGTATKCAPLSEVPGMTIRRDSVDHDELQLRIGIMDPPGEPKGDILFLHGFADRFDNHLPLFQKWRAEGLRVIAFDYPSHGETCGRGIDYYRINGVAAFATYAAQVAAAVGGGDRPLLVAGWSTGGLIAVRMLQAPQIARIGRPIKGAFLLAPGIDVPLVVGDKGMVTEETLTSDPNPPHRGAIAPKTPLSAPVFAADLLLNARHARNDSFPKDIPTFVVTGGNEEDVYVESAAIEAWVAARRAEGASVEGLKCEGARHELDNERAPIRDDVRTSAAQFASWIVGGATGARPAGRYEACRSY